MPSIESRLDKKMKIALEVSLEEVHGNMWKIAVQLANYDLYTAEAVILLW